MTQNPVEGAQRAC